MDPSGYYPLCRGLLGKCDRIPGVLPEHGVFHANNAADPALVLHSGISGSRCSFDRNVVVYRIYFRKVHLRRRLGIISDCGHFDRTGLDRARLSRANFGRADFGRADLDSTCRSGAYFIAACYVTLASAPFQSQQQR
ncbi:MAG: pentapeptide repeat-containing protein [Lachnospiraceae bacterium]|nr:pentapeptide repeat-containing protein [Lachnospiraceae bacterium]